MKVTQARQLKHYFCLSYFELKTLWICLLIYQKHFLLLYVFEINNNQIFAEFQSYFFCHKVSCSSFIAGRHYLRKIQKKTELLYGSVSSLSISGNLFRWGNLSLLSSKAKYIAEFANCRPNCTGVSCLRSTFTCVFTYQVPGFSQNLTSFKQE